MLWLNSLLKLMSIHLLNFNRRVLGNQSSNWARIQNRLSELMEFLYIFLIYINNECCRCCVRRNVKLHWRNSVCNSVLFYHLVILVQHFLVLKHILKWPNWLFNCIIEHILKGQQILFQIFIFFFKIIHLPTHSIRHGLF